MIKPLAISLLCYALFSMSFCVMQCFCVRATFSMSCNVFRVTKEIHVMVRPWWIVLIPLHIILLVCSILLYPIYPTYYPINN
jgi:uncharacterized membrane protein